MRRWAGKERLSSPTVPLKGKVMCEKDSDQIREDFGLSLSQIQNVEVLAIFGNFLTRLLARVIKKVACNDRVVKISVHGRGLDVFFGKKAQNDASAAESRQSTERLDLLKHAFENEGLESKVLKTWTPPKDKIKVVLEES